MQMLTRYKQFPCKLKNLSFLHFDYWFMLKMPTQLYYKIFYLSPPPPQVYVNELTFSLFCRLMVKFDQKCRLRRFVYICMCVCGGGLGYHAVCPCTTPTFAKKWSELIRNKYILPYRAKITKPDKVIQKVQWNLY